LQHPDKRPDPPLNASGQVNGQEAEAADRESTNISREKDAFFHFVTSNNTDQRRVPEETYVMHLTTKIGRVRLEVEREALPPKTDGEDADGPEAGWRESAKDAVKKCFKKCSAKVLASCGKKEEKKNKDEADGGARDAKTKKPVPKTFKQLKEEIANAITRAL